LETLQSLIEHYGYLAVFVGCVLEGETVLVLAGFAAHLGYLSLPAVIATAAIAGFIGDQVLYAIGRRWGERIFASHPTLAALRPRAKELVDRHGAWAAFGLRFLVGMRLAGAIAIGASGFPQRRYLPANAAGAIVWAVLIGCAGYAFGQAFTLFLERARHLELAAFAVLLALGSITVFMLRRRKRQWAGASAPR
jgi:membrane protein DedA with SNARE-associated domain